MEVIHLSKRELDVMKLLLTGKNHKEIASSIFITERTVKYHCSNIYSKYKVSGKVELLIKLGKNCTIGQEQGEPITDIIGLRGTLRTPINLSSVSIKGSNMRELTINELEIVSGGIYDDDVVAAVAAVAGGAGVGLAQWAGLTGAQQATVGGLFGLYGAALSTALYGGLTIGNWLNDNTPIQSWIQNALDEMSGHDGDGE